MTFRNLRSLAATNMFRAGVPLNQIKEQLGHTDAAITEIYLALDEEISFDAFSRINSTYDTEGGRK